MAGPLPAATAARLRARLPGLAAAGLTKADAAARLGVVASTITNWARQMGVVFKAPPGGPTAAQLVALRTAAADGLSQAETARRLGLDPNRVSTWSRRHGIVFRHGNEHPDMRARLAALAAAGLCKAAAARRLGVAEATVSRWARKTGVVFPPAPPQTRRMPGMPGPAKQAQLIALAAAGTDVDTAAAALDLSPLSVTRTAARLGLTIAGTDKARPRGAAKRRGVVDRSGRGRRRAVPRWVPICLVDEYREISAEEDEFAAARLVRQLKREMERPF